MGSTKDTWTKDSDEASTLADDVASMIKDLSSLPTSGPDTKRHTSAVRRKITILNTRLDDLESRISQFSSNQSRMNKELQKRQEKLANLRSRVKQMASTLKPSPFANREDLIGPSKISADEMNRTTGLDDRGIVRLQRQIMKEQDHGLEKLEEAVLSTKHIALAINEELDLHSRLIDKLDEHVEDTNSMLQRVQKRLAILNRQTKGGCSCKYLLLLVLGILILAAVAWALIKFL